MKTESSNKVANPLEAIRSEFETIPDTTDIGMLSIKSANRTLEDAARRPDPEQLYLELWYEGEVCCLFAYSNLGKSIFAVQMADTISQTRRVLYVDCELSDKQFQLRYTDKETGERHLFPDNLFRAEINPCAIGVERYEENIIKDIEMAAIRTATDVIIDNLTYLCNSSDKGVDAGLFMMNLMNLKKKYGWSLLIIAHTPKRSLMSPITQNDLAGSKKLYNFFDSVFAIGQSAKDKRLRYVKQVKVRAGAFKYDSSNVIVYEIEKNGRLPRLRIQRIRHRSRPPQTENRKRTHPARTQRPQPPQTRILIQKHSRENRNQQIHSKQHLQKAPVQNCPSVQRRWTRGHRWTA